MNIAYISCHDYGKFSIGYIDEETHLLDFLKQKGLTITREVWNEEATDWTQYDAAIIKSPWDYHERIDDFHTWLKKMQAMDIRLFNPAAMLRWNSDKHYLGDITKAGMNVIPTLFMEQGTSPSLEAIFDQLQTDQIIIKPCVSAGAKNIRTITLTDINREQDLLHKALVDESYITQPFIKEILAGELSCIFFNGEFSHCILNVPGEGDFRVQHYHGGSTKKVAATQQYIDSAKAYVKTFGQGSLYARVDGVIRNGTFHLMELELIEPFLYLDTDPLSYDRYYNALHTLIKEPATTQALSANI